MAGASKVGGWAWRGRKALAIGLGTSLATMGLTAASMVGSVGPAGAEAVTDTFTTPGTYAFTVPTGVTSIKVTVEGADGGDISIAFGGNAAKIVATLPVTPGETLSGTIGARGSTATTESSTGGGGPAGAGSSSNQSGRQGGGATTLIRDSGSVLLVVAGGGGGAGGNAGGSAGFRGGNGGNAGLLGGTGGSGEVLAAPSGSPGGGASASAAGTAGAAGSGGTGQTAGTAGTSLQGGAGGRGHTGFPAGGGGGGGGGGYLGGGGGGGGGDATNDGGGGAGGGGASYLNPSANATDVSSEDRGNLDTGGRVFIEYTVARNVFVSVTGNGKVDSSPTGITDCPADDCDGAFPGEVTLVATPDTGWNFSAWTGYDPCASAGTSCTFTPTGGDVSITAVFVEAPPGCGPVPDTAPPGYNLIKGTSKSERLTGTPGNDLIYGKDGGDTIEGKGGADILCGGPGKDELRGSDGDDWLDGGRDPDVLVGGDGTDTCVAGKKDTVKKCEATPVSTTD